MPAQRPSASTGTTHAAPPHALQDSSSYAATSGKLIIGPEPDPERKDEAALAKADPKLNDEAGPADAQPSKLTRGGTRSNSNTTKPRVSHDGTLHTQSCAKAAASITNL